MTLLQTLAKLWAKWFCPHYEVKHWSTGKTTRKCLQRAVLWANDCVGYKCKGCPL